MSDALPIRTDADMDFVVKGFVRCPQCDEPTTQATLNKYEMCYNCDRQACPECGQPFCDHNYS